MKLPGGRFGRRLGQGALWNKPLQKIWAGANFSDRRIVYQTETGREEQRDMPNIREEELRPPGLQDVVRPERGIFWKHGGWRNPGDRISRENLKNFVKLGQQEIF